MDLMTILAFVMTLIGFSVVGIVGAGGDGGGQGAGSGGSPPPAGSGAGADGAGSPPAGSGAPSPGASSESGNIKQLREQYETTKGTLTEWEKLGKREEVAQAYEVFTKGRNAAVEIGATLGYEQSEIVDAYREDPAGTMAFLRQKQAEAQRNASPQDLEKLLDKKLSQRLKPVLERDHQRLVDEANVRFDQAFDAKVKELWKDEDIPKEERETLYTVAAEMIKADPEAYKRVVNERKTSDVARIVEDARAFLDKYYLARAQREQKRVGGKPAGQGQGANAGDTKVTLDDMAAGLFPKTGPLAKYS